MVGIYHGIRCTGHVQDITAMPNSRRRRLLCERAQTTLSVAHIWNSIADIIKKLNTFLSEFIKIVRIRHILLKLIIAKIYT